MFSEGSFQVAFSDHIKGELELCASQTLWALVLENR